MDNDVSDMQPEDIEAAENTAYEPLKDESLVKAAADLGGQETAYLPEAGGVAWVDLFGNKTDENGTVHEVKISLTSRATTPRAALESLLDTMKVAKEIYKLNPYQNLKKAPEAAAPQKAPAPAGPAAPAPVAGAAPAPVGKPEPTYENLPGQGTGEFNVVKMAIAPRADGKTKVDFFETGHKYPDISAVMNPDALAQMMQYVGAWTPAHFQTIATYEVHYKISWRDSERMNQNGKPYKNIVSINPA